jgi:hypothetical protein
VFLLKSIVVEFDHLPDNAMVLEAWYEKEAEKEGQIYYIYTIIKSHNLVQVPISVSAVVRVSPMDLNNWRLWLNLNNLSSFEPLAY